MSGWVYRTDTEIEISNGRMSIEGKENKEEYITEILPKKKFHVNLGSEEYLVSYIEITNVSVQLLLKKMKEEEFTEKIVAVILPPENRRYIRKNI